MCYSCAPAMWLSGKLPSSPGVDVRQKDGAWCKTAYLGNGPYWT